MSQVAPAKNWSLTLFNFEESDIELIKRSKSIEKYACQVEKCPDTGKLHIQGFICFRDKVRFRKSDGQIAALEFIGKHPHWEKVKNLQAIMDYCTKSETLAGERFVSPSIALKKQELKIITELRDWQKDVINIIESEPDDRTVHWFWDKKGGQGKTALIKYILTHYETATISRCLKSADILTCASEERNIYLLDFPRTATDFCPYNAIEQLKDGVITECKLKKEQRCVIINPPHVICFANFPPKTNKLSLDRWNIIRLDEDDEEIEF